MDLGQSRRGVDMGPSALRGAGPRRIKKLGFRSKTSQSFRQQPEDARGEKRAKYCRKLPRPAAMSPPLPKNP